MQVKYIVVLSLSVFIVFGIIVGVILFMLSNTSKKESTDEGTDEGTSNIALPSVLQFMSPPTYIEMTSQTCMGGSNDGLGCNNGCTGGGQCLHWPDLVSYKKDGVVTDYQVKYSIWSNNKFLLAYPSGQKLSINFEIEDNKLYLNCNPGDENDGSPSGFKIRGQTELEVRGEVMPGDLIEFWSDNGNPGALMTVPHQLFQANPQSTDGDTPPASRMFSLTSSKTSANEGETFTITLTSLYDNISEFIDGQVVPYTITGIQPTDINESLSGNFTVAINEAQKEFTVDADAQTENNETFTLSLNDETTSVSVTINDTSQTPPPTPTPTPPDPAQTYNITVTYSSFSYVLNGTDRVGSVSGTQPSVTIHVGDTLNFNLSNIPGSHPFRIRTSSGEENVSTPSASGQSSTGNSTVSWTPNEAGAFVYQCSNHSSMKGDIIVT